MGVGGGVSAASVVLTAELCAPLLLLCGLCCWPDDEHSDTSSTGTHPQKPVITKKGSSRRRSSETLSRRAGSSAASLHLPSTSGHSKQSLAAHRSHEEIRSRRRSHLEPRPAQEDSHYHSAPSVIDEVLHRRDWEKSSKELYIPLKPDTEVSDVDSDVSSPPAPHAEPESSSIECINKDDRPVPCKKHHTNIKSSRNRTSKERNQSDVKDTDATENETETSNFYIGETRTDNTIITESQETAIMLIDEPVEKIKSVYKAKDAKQSFNESMKCKEKAQVFDDDKECLFDYYQVKAVDIDLDLCEDMDRSGAMHPDVPTPGSLTTVVSRTELYPPSSVEAVGWEGGACYLARAESGLRARLLAWPSRARHASDGDILAPAGRPESGPFSESDLELEAEGAVEQPPPYEELQRNGARKETAI